MNELSFIKIQKDDLTQCEIFKALMFLYNREIGAAMPDGTPVSDEFIVKWAQSCIEMQGPHDRHLELVLAHGEPAGFLYGKIDHEGHRGFIKPEYGYIMEFYVKPEYRRSNYGSIMFRRLEHHFFRHGAKRMYLTSKPSGRVFWKAMGFIPTGEDSPENNIPIYEKEVSSLSVKPMRKEQIESAVRIITSDKNKKALHLGNQCFSEWYERFAENLCDPDEANFIIDDGVAPIAWVKINGLQSAKQMAWLSMLCIDENYHRQGIGSYATRFAEDFVLSKGFQMLGVHTTAENVAAQGLYRKLGYFLHDEWECTTDDGVKRHELAFRRDNLSAVQMDLDGVVFHIGEPHDFSFIHKIGRVFRVFDAMDSGNICFGVEGDGKRYFVKYAGARTQNYKGKTALAVSRLKNAVGLYGVLQHPYLIRLISHYPVNDGYVAVFDWVNGEGLRSYWDFVGKSMWNSPASPNHRFRRLPIEKRIAVVDKLLVFHRHVMERGYIPVDFYDGSMIYDFNTEDFHICDIDFYRKAPAKNDMGRMWGSSRFMSPEEYRLGADLDERTVVYLMGASAFELLSNDTNEAYQAWASGTLHRSFSAWSASKALFDVAIKAVSLERNERYSSISELIEAWNDAKDAGTTAYPRE